MDDRSLTVLCVGNRFVSPDGAACWLYDEMAGRAWPDGVRWVDGGLGGLSLLPWFEMSDRVLVVDYMPAWPPGTLLSLEKLHERPIRRYDHDSALRYLLMQLPVLLERVPEVTLMSCHDEREARWRNALEGVMRWLRKSSA